MPSPTQKFFEHGGAWVVAQIGLLTLLFVSALFDGSAPPTFSHPRSLVALLLFTSGALLGISGARCLGRNLTPLPKPREENELVTHGPYNLVRHPLYTCLITLGTSWALYWQSPTATLTTLLLALLLNAKASREESWLSQKHPHYRLYQTRVKKLIPWIY